MTRVKGIFACGNVLHVHDLVDFVTEEARRCGDRVVAYLHGEQKQKMLAVIPGANVRYVVPNSFAPGRQNVLFLRPLVVKNDALLEVRVGAQEIKSRRLAHVQPSEMIRLDLDEKAVRAFMSRAGGAKSAEYGGAKSAEYGGAKSAEYGGAMEVSIR
jgi:hypothetical protein